MSSVICFATGVGTSVENDRTVCDRRGDSDGIRTRPGGGHDPAGDTVGVLGGRDHGAGADGGASPSRVATVQTLASASAKRPAVGSSTGEQTRVFEQRLGDADSPPATALRLDSGRHSPRRHRGIPTLVSATMTVCPARRASTRVGGCRYLRVRATSGLVAARRADAARAPTHVQAVLGFPSLGSCSQTSTFKRARR